MSSLVIIPYVIVLVILVLALAGLVYNCGAYKAQVTDLMHEVQVGKAQITFWKGCEAKEKERKLYTFESGVNRIENVVAWREISKQLRLTLDDGSLCVLSIPPYYKLIVQDQSEEGTK